MSYIGSKPANKIVTASDMEDGVVSTDKLAANAVVTSKITDGTIATADVANDAVTLAKMAAGTDGNIISYDASGNPVAVATGSDGQVLTSTGAGSPPAFEAVPGGGLDHIFSVKLAGNQSFSEDTITKVAFATEEIDTAGAFASNKFTVPSGQAGKYFFSAFVVLAAVDARQQQLYIYKNGSAVKAVHHYTDAGEYDDIYDLEISCILDLSATDYIEVYVLTDCACGGTVTVNSGVYSSFQGFKLA